MSKEWKVYNLIDITTKIGSGATPKGGKEAYKNEGISLIRSQNVLDYTFTSDGLAFIDKNQAEKLKNVIIKENDVLINITGDSVARVCSVPKEYIPARVNQHVAILRANPELLDWAFLKYFLLSPFQKNQLLNLASSGATRNALTKSMLENFEINLPPLPEQKAIAHILGKLDDKIELNRQMNQTLEQMAQALFQSWFVDFDPVLDNAMAQGKAIPEALLSKAEKRNAVPSEQKLLHTNPKLAAQFPNSFVFNETLEKWIPEGWEVKELEDITSKLGDGLHGTPEYDHNGDYFFVNGNNLTEGKVTVNANTKRVNKTQFDKYRKELNDRTIFVSINGTIGNVSVYDGERVVLGKSVCYFNVKENIDKDYVKQAIDGDYFFKYLENIATGTTIKYLAKRNRIMFSVFLQNIYSTIS